MSLQMMSHLSFICLSFLTDSAPVGLFFLSDKLMKFFFHLIITCFKCLTDNFQISFLYPYVGGFSNRIFNVIYLFNLLDSIFKIWLRIFIFLSSQETIQLKFVCNNQKSFQILLINLNFSLINVVKHQINFPVVHPIKI